jgi:polyphosphate glucokinase
MRALGIDIGGTGIKAAPVDVDTGQLLTERTKIDTPRPAVPEAVARVVERLVSTFAWSGPVGITFPGVVADGVIRTAANLDPAWIGLDAATLLGQAASSPVRVLNDADAAGVAEVAAGSARGEPGVVLMLTFGTGIGSALFVDGHLVPNTELGHLEVDGKDAETRAADSARERDDLSWQQWAKRLTKYFQAIERLLWPDLIVVGGGVSKKSDKFLSLIDVRTPIVASQLRNDGGIIGAALLAAERSVPVAAG